ncbi:MAG: hypothetical protein IJK99_09325 [Bacteroidales bacterium]|nr:hypothetical protein [Bacteroidales bacterium]
MRLVFDIEKEDLMALVVLLKAKSDERQAIRDFLNTHDEIVVPDELLNDEDSTELRMALGLMAIGSIGKSLDE